MCVSYAMHSMGAGMKFCWLTEVRYLGLGWEEDALSRYITKISWNLGAQYTVVTSLWLCDIFCSSYFLSWVLYKYFLSSFVKSILPIRLPLLCRVLYIYWSPLRRSWQGCLPGECWRCTWWIPPLRATGIISDSLSILGLWGEMLSETPL